MAKKNKNTIRQNTTTRELLRKIEEERNQSPVAFRAAIILSIIIGDVIVGLIASLASGRNFGIGNVILNGIFGPQIIGTIVIALLIMVGLHAVYQVTHDDSVYDPTTERDADPKGVLGKAHTPTIEEVDKAFENGDYEKNGVKIRAVSGYEAPRAMPVIGTDIYTDKPRSVRLGYGINGNSLICGSPGSGKSRCYIIPAIFETIRKGESLIITDPKMELYGKTSEVARVHGYTVKIFNVNPLYMLHSDSCNFMGIIGDNTFLINAFVDTIMSNISGTIEPDFWNKSQLNELNFVTKYIATNEIGYPKTIGGIYNFINSMSVEEMEDFFMQLPDEHPCKPEFRTWAQGDATVKGNTHAGLQIDLKVLANPLVQKITGENDIDLVLPGKEKCIYYVAMSDQERSMSFLVALFFTLLYQQLVNYADSLPERRLPVKVTMLLDEFYNIGLIPYFDSRISQVRSRGIDTTIVIQSLGQIQKMYPENVWESIIDCCSTMMCLATRSMLTAEYFSKYSGDQTVITSSYRYEETLGVRKNTITKTVTKTKQKRPLYTPHEIITKNPDHILVSTSTYDMFELKKLDYSKHPMCKEIREVLGSEHLPKWVSELPDAEREKFKADDETYTPEGIWNQELCTEEDFLSEWTKEKEKALQEKIKKEAAKLGLKIQEMEDDKSRLALAEDGEYIEEEDIFEANMFSEDEDDRFENQPLIKKGYVYRKPKTIEIDLEEGNGGSEDFQINDFVEEPEQEEKKVPSGFRKMKAQKSKSFEDFFED